MRISLLALCLASFALARATFARTPEPQDCAKASLGITMALSMQAACEPLSPAYAQNKPLIEKWLQKLPACPGVPAPNMDQIRQQVAALQAERPMEKDAAVRDCATHELEVAAQFRPKAATYATPEATWKEFRAAMLSRDRARVLRCLATTGDFANILREMSDTELVTFSKSLANIETTPLIGGDYMEAITETTAPDGTKRGGTVLFAKINGNWMIASL